MKYFLLIINALTFCAVAQDREQWHAGAAVTSRNEVITGEILYHPGFDMIVIKGNDSLQVLPAHQLNTFRYFDGEANINRKFVAIHIGRAESMLLEIVVSGQISVLRKPILHTMASDEFGFDYYFIVNDKLENLKKFRTHLYPKLKEALLLEEKIYHLNPNLPADAIRYIELYNRKMSVDLVASR